MSNGISADLLKASIENHLNFITEIVNNSFQGSVSLSHVSKLCED